MEKKALIKSWILAHVRQQKSIRKGVSSYPMKGLVERELGEYITEQQFVEAMVELGYRHEDGYFNSILALRMKPDQDKHTAIKWGFSKQAHAQWARRSREQDRVFMP
jgi:hypothetical protein